MRSTPTSLYKQSRISYSPVKEELERWPRLNFLFEHVSFCTHLSITTPEFLNSPVKEELECWFRLDFWFWACVVLKYTDSRISYSPVNKKKECWSKLDFLFEHVSLYTNFSIWTVRNFLFSCERETGKLVQVGFLIWACVVLHSLQYTDSRISCSPVNKKKGKLF